MTYFSWEQMEWNVTGNIEIDVVDSVNELCVRFSKQLNYTKSFIVLMQV